jgi:hypothetical protein
LNASSYDGNGVVNGSSSGRAVDDGSLDGYPRRASGRMNI